MTVERPPDYVTTHGVFHLVDGGPDFTGTQTGTGIHLQHPERSFPDQLH